MCLLQKSIVRHILKAMEAVYIDADKVRLEETQRPTFSSSCRSLPIVIDKAELGRSRSNIFVQKFCSSAPSLTELKAATSETSMIRHSWSGSATSYQSLTSNDSPPTQQQLLTPSVALNWMSMGTNEPPMPLFRTKPTLSRSAAERLQAMDPPCPSNTPTSVVEEQSNQTTTGSCLLSPQDKPVAFNRARADARGASLATAEPGLTNTHEPAGNGPKKTSPTSLFWSEGKRLHEWSETSLETLPERPKMNDKAPWRSAVDKKSGRTYYYHVETRETTWHKPLALASEEERAAAELKERQQREFFAAMEANILQSITTGAYVAAVKAETPSPAASETAITTSATVPRPTLIRTISTMEDTILRDLILTVPSVRQASLGMSLLSIQETVGNDEDEDDECWDEDGDRLALAAKASVSASLHISTMQGSHQRPSSPSASFNSSRCSMVSLLGHLPSERPQDQEARNGFDSLDVGRFSFAMSDEEAMALREVAGLADEMMLLGESDEEEEELDGVALLDEPQAPTLTPDGDSEKELARQAKSVLVEDDGEEKEEEAPPQWRAPKTDPQSERKASMRASWSESQFNNDGPEKPPTISMRRNTCGTIYVGSTMSMPDVDATIKCVCGVYRAHILQSEDVPVEDEETYRVFDDETAQPKFSASTVRTKPQAPSLDEITTFYRNLYLKAKMEMDCVILSLIYVERLIKMTEGALRPRPENWRSLLFSCLALASKVTDDCSMWNGDFSLALRYVSLWCHG